MGAPDPLLAGAKRAMGLADRVPEEERPWMPLGMAYALASAFLPAKKKEALWGEVARCLQEEDYEALAKLAKEVAWEAFLREGVGEFLLLASFPEPRERRKPPNLLFIKGVAYGRECLARPLPP